MAKSRRRQFCLNKETGLKRTAKTDESGRFNFPQLKPGTVFCQGGSAGLRATAQK